MIEIVTSLVFSSPSCVIQIANSRIRIIEYGMKNHQPLKLSRVKALGD